MGMILYINNRVGKNASLTLIPFLFIVADGATRTLLAICMAYISLLSGSTNVDPGCLATNKTEKFPVLKTLTSNGNQGRIKANKQINNYFQIDF